MNLTVYVTYNCNCNCSYCDILKKNIEMDISFYDFAIKNRNIVNIYMLGGEPSLYSCFDEMIKINKNNNIKTNIITNGYCIDNILKCDSIILSLDGIEEYNNLKRKNQNYQKCMDIIKYCKKNNIDITINKVIDYDELEKQYLGKNIEYLKSLNIPTNYIIANNMCWDLNRLNETIKFLNENDISTQHYNFNCSLNTMYLLYDSSIKKWIFSNCFVQEQFKKYHSRCIKCINNSKCMICFSHTKHNSWVTSLRCNSTMGVDTFG